MRIYATQDPQGYCDLKGKIIKVERQGYTITGEIGFAMARTALEPQAILTIKLVE